MWWRDGVLYQIYPRSFADANGDGVGDLRGIIDRLDHLEWLGVDGVWLSPITLSPNADWGYDVSDYCDVDPAFGTLADLDALVAAAEERGIRVILDIVPNHTSVEHPWFVDARTSRTARHREWYVWADPGPGGSPPNNWTGGFTDSVWTLDPVTGQMYLHNFLPEQADLNWSNEEVRAEFERILRFWFDRGVAGFRVDVAQMLVKDDRLRDDPPATDGDDWYSRLIGVRQVYSRGRPEVHDVYRRWREIADSYDPPRVLVGETWVQEIAQMASYYGNGHDELDLAFNFPFLFSRPDPAALARIVDETEAALPPGAWPVWTLGNHDVSRFPTRWARGDRDRTRALLLMLLTLRGTPFLYYGDELGMTDVPVELPRDPMGRDPERSPMPWPDVDAQRADADSTLNLCRDLVALRRERTDLQGGDYRALSVAAGIWAWQRGAGTVVALNLGRDPATLDDVTGTIAICTDRERDGDAVTGSLTLPPNSAAVVLVQ
jgi:alpha-glucosidase